MKTKLDRLLLNGVIHTMRNEAEVVEALGIQAGKIVFAGSDAEALTRYEADDTIDLARKTVIPGLGDSHMHFYAVCQALTVDPGSSVGSRAEAKDYGKPIAENGFSWHDNHAYLCRRYLEVFRGC